MKKIAIDVLDERAEFWWAFLGMLVGFISAILFKRNFGIGFGIGFCIITAVPSALLFSPQSGIFDAVCTAGGYFVAFTILHVFGGGFGLASSLNLLTGFILGLMAGVAILCSIRALMGWCLDVSESLKRRKKMQTE